MRHLTSIRSNQQVAAEMTTAEPMTQSALAEELTLVNTALLSELKSRTEPSANCICRLSVDVVGMFSGE